MRDQLQSPDNHGSSRSGNSPREAGQSTVEFMLMIVVIMVVMLSFFTFTFLGAQALLTRYTSFAGARAYLAYSNGFGNDWKKAAEAASRLIPNRAGSLDAETVNDGVRVRIKVRELFPSMGIYGSRGIMELEATTRLGTERAMGGDNAL